VIRAIVIDDSAYNRVTLSRLLERGGQISVVATAVNGEDGIKQVLRHKPDVITLDLEMPLLDGFAFLRWLMANHPTPVIVVSSRSSDRSVFKALEFGAVDFIAKPGGRVSTKLEEIERDLVQKVLNCTEVRLENVRKRPEIEEQPEDLRPPVVTGRVVDLVVIGSSTGGPPALQHVFQSLPLIPIPIVVAQHMPPTFTRLFAERVDRLTRYRVKEADHGEVLMPGTVYIGPGGRQTEIGRSGDVMRIKVSDKSPEELYSPSVNRLFDSASDVCADRLVAVVLTGMGDDGAQAIRKVHARGGKTIAESASTAIIFGMPGEAIKTGSVQYVLPLTEIPEAVHQLCTGGTPPSARG
jgi:two-component system, chemotaxis family, protein-glutamate methylesterase/glutaminase